RTAPPTRARPPSNAPFAFLASLPDALAPEAALPARDDVLVVDVVGDLAAQRAQDRLGGPGDARTEAATHVVGHHVRRKQHPVAEVAQLAVERQRLFLEHVERGAADVALQQRLDQRRLPYAGAARGIDQDGVTLHERELLGADHV